LAGPAGLEPATSWFVAGRKEATGGGGTPPPPNFIGVLAHARQLETTPNRYALSPIRHPLSVTSSGARGVSQSAPSGNLNERLAPFECTNNGGPVRFDSAQQLRATSVSDPNPHHRRTALQHLTHHEVLILRHDDCVGARRVASDLLVRCGCKATFRDVLRCVAVRLDAARERRRELRVDEEAQLHVPQDWMIALTGREFEDRGDVGRFEIRVVAQDFFARRARGEQVEHVFHADAESADARAATADVRTHRDSFDGAHVPCLQAIDSIILARLRRTAIAICTIWPPAIDSLTGDDRTIADFIGWEQPASVLAFVRGLADEQHFLARDRVRRVADRGLDIGLREPCIRVEQFGLGRAFTQLAKDQPTGIRVPRMIGLPSMTRGFSSMRSVTVIQASRSRSRLCDATLRALNCSVDAPTRFSPGNRHGGARLETIEARPNLGRPGGFGAFVDLAIEALDQLPCERGALLVRESKRLYQQLSRVHTERLAPQCIRTVATTLGIGHSSAQRHHLAQPGGGHMFDARWDNDPRDRSDERSRRDGHHRSLGDVGGPHVGRGPGAHKEQSDPGARQRDDERWPQRDRDPREQDPRDVFGRQVDLPRGRDREIVHDARDRVYTLRGSESRTLATVGSFRVVSARDLRDHNDRAADPRSGDLRHLREQGLVETVRLDGRRDVAVVLTDRGRDLLESHRDRDQEPRQAFYSGLKREREVEHDSQVYRAYEREAERLAERDVRIDRVVLDYELKREYQQWLHQRDRDRDDYDGHPDRDAQEVAQWALEHDLPYFDDQVHFPDLRIEYEEPDGRWGHQDVEVLTVHYRGAHAAAAARSGFTAYRGFSARIGGRSGGGGRGGGRNGGLAEELLE
jgi:DNA-binding MarR family transcriptional regulator